MREGPNKSHACGHAILTSARTNPKALLAVAGR
jgi:hypothetical protein